jgi:restriction system protein
MELFYILFGLFFLSYFLYQKFKTKKSHKWRRKSAKQTVEKLRKFSNNAHRLSYLRKVDPFVFEEMILYSLSLRKDVKIIKANRYTGDGGIDGRFIFKGHTVLIQAKRYTNYIQKKHVEEFCEVLRKENAYGLFVHTGKTGKKTRESFCDNLKLISGEKMLDLLFKSEF